MIIWVLWHPSVMDWGGLTAGPVRILRIRKLSISESEFLGYIYIYIYMYVHVNNNNNETNNDNKHDIYIYMYLAMLYTYTDIPMGLGIPPLRSENLLESNTAKSRFLVRGLTVWRLYVLTSCMIMGLLRSGSYFKGVNQSHKYPGITF